MTIFLVLNGMGVVFLLYVLANFWKEGRRSQTDTRRCATEFVRLRSTDLIVVPQPISHEPHGGLSVIPFRARDRKFVGQQAHEADSRESNEMPTRRLSTR